MIGAPTTTSVRAVATWTLATGFDTVITTRSLEPRSASVSRYWLGPPHGASEEHVCAPVGVRGTARGGSALTGTQSARFPSSGQRCHWWVIASGGWVPEKPLQSPEVAVIVWPRAAVPVSAGRPFGAPARLTGPPRAGCVGRLSRCVATGAALLFATTTSLSVEPRSASVTTYRQELALFVCRYGSGPVVTAGATGGCGSMTTQLVPVGLHRCHCGVRVGAGNANHTPADARQGLAPVRNAVVGLHDRGLHGVGAALERRLSDLRRRERREGDTG